MGVSVVIPTFNRADLVVEAVASALAQAWEPLEVIVVDDASSDDTVARLELIGATDPRLRVIALAQNGGESAARNQGVLAANHAYVALLDSDNRFMPTKLVRQMPSLLSGPPGAVSFTAYLLARGDSEDSVVLERWSPTRPATLEALLTGCCVNTSTFVAPREILIGEGRFRPELRCCEDHDLWLRLAVLEHPFLYVNEPLTWYRSHVGSLSADQRRVAAASEQVISEFFDRGDVPAEFQRRRSRYAARWALNAAVGYAAAGDGRSALTALARAVRFRPLSARPGWLWLAAKSLASR